MTNEDTHTKGFSESGQQQIEEPCEGTDCDKVKNLVRGRIVNIAHLTSNALALVNNLAATQG